MAEKFLSQKWWGDALTVACACQGISWENYIATRKSLFAATGIMAIGNLRMLYWINKLRTVWRDPTMEINNDFEDLLQLLIKGWELGWYAIDTEPSCQIGLPNPETILQLGGGQ